MDHPGSARRPLGRRATQVEKGNEDGDHSSHPHYGTNTTRAKVTDSHVDTLRAIGGDGRGELLVGWLQWLRGWRWEWVLTATVRDPISWQAFEKRLGGLLGVLHPAAQPGPSGAWVVYAIAPQHRGVPHVHALLCADLSAADIEKAQAYWYGSRHARYSGFLRIERIRSTDGALTYLLSQSNRNGPTLL